MAMVYGDGTNSSINSTGTTQIRTDYFYKKALVEVAKEAYFANFCR